MLVAPCCAGWVLICGDGTFIALQGDGGAVISQFRYTRRITLRPGVTPRRGLPSGQPVLGQVTTARGADQ
jgi:hypothetical protein